MTKKIVFDDDSIVEWVDKETLRYSKGIFSALVWVDFEPGFFSQGRIIRASSITEWESKPVKFPPLIDGSSKKEIISKIQEYYRRLKKKCRVDED